MSLFPLEHRPALDRRNAIDSANIKLQVRPEGHVLHVLSAAPGQDLAETIAAVTGRDRFSLRAISPGQWVLVGDEPLSATSLADMARALKPHGDVVNQSHGRIRISIEGTKAASVLAKGTAADLSPDIFSVADATTTLFGHIPIHIARVSQDGFEIMVLRSFAQSLWDELADLCREFHSA